MEAKNYLKLVVFNLAQIVTNIWITIAIKFTGKNFEKSLNLVTLVTAHPTPNLSRLCNLFELS